jgi:PAS domain S-box-containing protein
VGTIVPPSESTGRDLANLTEEICADPERFMDIENENITKDGRRVWLRWMNRAILDNTGKHVGVLAVGIDITRQKQAEEEKDRLLTRTELLLEENRHFIQQIGENMHFIQRIIDTTPNILYIYDLLEKRNVFANRELTELLGFTKKEVLEFGPNFLSSIVHPDDIGLVNEHHKAFAAATDNEIFEIEYRVKDSYGQWRWLHSRDVIFAKTPDGTPKQMLGIAEDITAKKHDEEKLRFFSAAVEQALDGVQITDPAGNIFYSNKAIKHIYGYSPEELNGKNVNDLNVDPEIAGMVIFPSMMDTGHWSGELEVWHKNGHQFSIWLNASVIKDQHGLPVAGIGIIRDITKRKEAEEALKKAHDELENRVRERTAELSLANAALEKEKQYIKITNTLLKLFIQNVSLKEYLDAVVGIMQQWSNCRCVGIRILNENGYMPYESYVGYSQEFLDSENILSVNKDQCACIRLITGSIEPQDLSVMTQYGSFYPVNYLEYIERLPEFEKSRFLGACVRSGFKSVAIVPIIYHGKVVGVIHFADEKEGVATLDKVLFAEQSATIIGEAIYKFNAEENLRKSKAQLRNLTAYLQEIRENERTIIAREIHDELGQIMTALKIDLSWIRDKYKDHDVITEKTKSMLAL